MVVYNGIEKFPGAKNAVVTIGTFDGVHIGHRAIISQLKHAAEEIGGESVILSFHPHPRHVLFPDEADLFLLHTEEEKKELLEKTGINHLIVHPFTKKFSRLSYVEYVRNILVNKLKTKKLIVGYNHCFGRNREGSYQQLKKLAGVYGFEVEKIPSQIVNKVEVSSTKIRNSLLQGDIKTANKLLGYEYFMSGKVVKGKGLGKKLGYPTANIVTADPHKLIPANGIYAVETEYNEKKYPSMMSIGYNPTVNKHSHRQTLLPENKTLEVNIFDFEKEIYGETIRVFFRQKLRDEKKFDNLESLKKAIDSDKEKTIKIFSS